MYPLIVISHSEVFTGEAAIIQQLFAEGLHCFHLRKPGAGEEEVRQLLDAIPAEYHPRIALHAFHHLADEYGIQRLHFTEQHRIVRVNYTALKEKGYILSTSVHDLQTLQTLSTCFSYAFFGPLFNSISKKNYTGIAGKNFYIPNDLKVVPVIALGGINAGNISEVPDMNFDGAAVLGALWQEPGRALEEFRLLQKITLAEAQRR
jgi:thiamine-phosphate pyrophosphorylase